MDLLNTFILVNLTVTLAVFVAFFFMRENTLAATSSSGKRFASFNIAGATGVATSIVFLVSVATLFR